jgi:hypothetical protein
MPLPSHDVTRKSTLSIRLMLKEFCLQLLNGAYNFLMHTVKGCLVRLKSKTTMKIITSSFSWSLTGRTTATARNSELSWSVRPFR